MSSREVTVADFGEQPLVSRVIELLGVPAGGVVCGPGDDAAIVGAADTKLVLTTDSQLEDVHFKCEWIEPANLGRRSLAVNVSDIAAMGAEPRWALCALSLPPATTLSWVDDLVRGLRAAGEAFGCPVVGGDVARVSERLGITVSVVGCLSTDVDPILRSGAKVGDGCWLTGYPGRAAAGRALLAAGYRLRADGGVELGGESLRDPAAAADAGACLAAYLVPEPPLALGPVIAAGGLANAMIDLSDGLAIDALRVCDASGVGLLIDGDLLSSDSTLLRWDAAGMGSSLEWVLGGGEDYQLLCAVPPDAEGRLVSVAGELRVDARRVGEFRPVAEGKRVQSEGEARSLSAEGWDHFASSGQG